MLKVSFDVINDMIIYFEKSRSILLGFSREKLLSYLSEDSVFRTPVHGLFEYDVK